MIEHRISGERAYSLADISRLTGIPLRTLQHHAQGGRLRAVGGLHGQLVRESELHRYTAARGIALQLPGDLTEGEREELEALRAEAIAREQRAQERYERDMERFRTAEQQREFDTLAERMRLQQEYDRGQR